jgi:nitrogen regulatory protein P-II 1
MKEIEIFISPERLFEVTDILHKHNVGGVTFFEINGSGRTKREPIPEIVRSYMTGKNIIPEFAKRIKVEAIVPDSSAKQIIDDILNNISPGSDAHGMIFVKEVANAYEIGTKQSGDAALSPK